MTSRAARRLLVVFAAVGVTAGIFTYAVSARQPGLRVKAAPCSQRLTIIGARGSGDPQDGDVAKDKWGETVHGFGKPGAAFAVGLANYFSRGEVTFLPVVYPAVGLLGDWQRIINLVGAGVHIGSLGAYTGSVKAGSAILRQAIRDEERLCSNLKLVLVGYSQGAQVVADVYERDLAAAQRKRIVGVVVFGDPYFNPDDTAVAAGSYDPTRHGILGTRASYPTNANGRVFSICHGRDPICQGPGRVAFSQHTNYERDPWVTIAAARVAAELTRSAKASLATFAGSWGGHTRSLTITRDGQAVESIGDGCCDPLIDLKFRLSAVSGTKENATARITVTGVTVRDPQAFTNDPVPEVGQTGRLSLKNGVITQSLVGWLTGVTFCNGAAAARSVCGA